MKQLVPIGICMIIVLMLSGCGSAFYGPKRLIYNDYIAGGHPQDEDVAAKRCETTVGPGAIETTNLTENFYRTGCNSLRKPNNPAHAKRMARAGINLALLRCADFFAARAAHQTGERIARGVVIPISTALTGLIALKDFDTEKGRDEALQVLALGQAATIAGLELYEEEFLFGSENITTIRKLTMLAMRRDAARILNTDNLNFYSAANLLIEHQLICTPANILALSQEAIREGTARAAVPIASEVTPPLTDSEIIGTLSDSLNAGNRLTADQLGALWWLEKEAKVATPKQNNLAIIQSRLSDLPLNPVSGTAPDLTIVSEFEPLLAEQMTALSASVTNRFVATRKILESSIAGMEPADSVESTKDTHFNLPPGLE